VSKSVRIVADKYREKEKQSRPLSLWERARVRALQIECPPVAMSESVCYNALAIKNIVRQRVGRIDLEYVNKP